MSRVGGVVRTQGGRIVAHLRPVAEAAEQGLALDGAAGACALLGPFGISLQVVSLAANIGMMASLHRRVAMLAEQTRGLARGIDAIGRQLGRVANLVEAAFWSDVDGALEDFRLAFETNNGAAIDDARRELFRAYQMCRHAAASAVADKEAMARPDFLTDFLPLGARLAECVSLCDWTRRGTEAAHAFAQRATKEMQDLVEALSRYGQGFEAAPEFLLEVPAAQVPALRRAVHHAAAALDRLKDLAGGIETSRAFGWSFDDWQTKVPPETRHPPDIAWYAVIIERPEGQAPTSPPA